MSYTIKPAKYQAKTDSLKPSQLTESIITNNNKNSYLIEMNNHHHHHHQQQQQQRVHNLDGSSSSFRKNQSETKENFKFEINIDFLSKFYISTLFLFIIIRQEMNMLKKDRYPLFQAYEVISFIF